MNLAGEQLKDTYGNLVTTGTTAGSPTTGGLQNGDGTLLTSVGIGTNSTSAKLTLNDAGQQVGIDFKENGTTRAHIEYDGSLPAFKVGSNGSAYLSLRTNNDEKLRIEADGDIAFYDDADNQGLFWDASAGSLGLGTQTPATLNHISASYSAPTGGIDANVQLLISNTSGYAGVNILGGSSGGGFINFGDTDDSNVGQILYTSSNDSMSFTTGASLAMTIDSSGTIKGIGTYGAGSSIKIFEAERLGGAVASDWSYDDASTDMSLGTSTGHSFSLKTSDTNRLTIDSSGNVGIGVSPDSVLHIKDDTSTVYDATAYQKDLLIERKNTSGDGQSAHLRFVVTGHEGSTTGDASIGAVQTANASSADLVFTTRNTGTRAERMRIDSSGNVGIGVTPSAPLSFGKTAYGEPTSEDFFRIKLQDSGGTTNDVGIGQPANGAMGFNVGASSGYFTFNTGTDGERMRIDSSGTLLVGKTASGLATTGFQAIKSGQSAFVSDGDRSLILNRKTSDGSILEFRKDESEVGSIGTEGGDMAIGNGDAGLQFIDGTQSVRPFNMTTNARLDAQVDLGMSNTRFKDLYLSGSVGIGGTSIGAKLDIQGTDTEPLTVLNDTVYTFAANVTTSQSNTHTVTIPFTSQVSQYSNFLVEIYASLSWVSNSQVFAGRALYTFTTLNSIGTITEIEDTGQNLSFSASSSGMNFVVTITTTGLAGQEPSRIGVMAKVIRSNGSVGNQPTSMTLA